MKRMNYPESYLFDFETLSSLVEELLKESKIEDYQDVLNNALSLEQLQLNIKDHMKIQRYLFEKLKKCADLATDYLELERYIIYMNVLIDHRYPPLIKYKQSLFEYILACREDYFTSDEYCVIRHLIPFKEENINTILEIGWQGLSKNNILYQIFTCEIYLIEGQYSKARQYLEEIGFISLLADYQEDYLLSLKHQIKIKPIFVSKFNLQYN